MVMMVRKKLLLQGQEPRGDEEPRDGGSRGFPRHEAKGGSSIARRLGTRLSTNLSHNQVFLNTALSGVLNRYYYYYCDYYSQGETIGTQGQRAERKSCAPARREPSRGPRGRRGACGSCNR